MTPDPDEEARKNVLDTNALEYDLDSMEEQSRLGYVNGFNDAWAAALSWERARVAREHCESVVQE